MNNNKNSVNRNNNGHTVKWVGIIVSIIIVLVGGAVAANRVKLEKHDDILMELKSDTSYIRAQNDMILKKLD